MLRIVFKHKIVLISVEISDVGMSLIVLMTFLHIRVPPGHLSALCPHKQLCAPHLDLTNFDTLIELTTRRV